MSGPRVEPRDPEERFFFLPGSPQTPSPVTEIEVPAASNDASTAFYDVAATFTFR
jgi:hypothetical protein